MMFTLIKNELIKITRRGKTWVVFGLFLLMTIGINTMLYFDSKQMEYNMSPQGRIESIDNQLEWRKRDLKNEEEYLKTNKGDKDYLEQIKSDIERLELERKVYEEQLKTGVNPDQWKEDLKKEKENLTSQVNSDSMDERSKGWAKQRLEEIKIIEEAGIKPVESWEFNPYNNAAVYLNLLGMIILVAGIAVFMSDIVSGESTPPTLKFLLVQPISRGKVLISKFIAVVATVVTMIGGLELLAFGVVGAITGFDGGKMPILIGQKYKLVMNNYGFNELQRIDNSAVLSNMSQYIGKAFLFQLLFIVACCAFIFLISTLFKSSMITMAVSVLLTVATFMASMSVGAVKRIAHLIFLNYGATTEVISGNIAYVYNNTNFTVNLGVMLMCGTIVICPLIAYFVFKKKDILI